MSLSKLQKAAALAGLAAAPATAHAGVSNITAAVKIDNHTQKGQSDARGDEKFAAIAVRKFGRSARPEDMRVVAHAMAGSDQPVLNGLRTILETVLDAQDEDEFDEEDDIPARRADDTARHAARY